MLKACPKCSTPIPKTESHCAAHKPVDGRPSAARRGYGPEWQKQRKRWRPQVNSGTVRCRRGATCFRAERVGGVLVGGLIRPGEPWDLGHDDSDRSLPPAPEHLVCNRATSTHKAARR